MKTHATSENLRTGFAAIVCLLLGWTFGGSSRAQDSPMLDYVDQNILDVGAQLQNAKMRLGKDFAGTGPDAAGEQVTPVVACCRTNLESIDAKLKNLRGAMESMLEFYRGQHNSTAVSILAQMNGRLDQITTGMVFFARAPTVAKAFDARNGLIRPWNEYRNGVRVLRGCCPVPIEVASEASPDDDDQADRKQADEKGEKKSKKDKKDKKKQRDEEP